MRGMARRSLVIWSWVVLALLAAHDVTHLLDGGLETTPGQLALVSVPQWLFLGVAMAMILRGSRPAALLLGASVVIGFAVIHALPASPASFFKLDPSLVSWALAVAAAAAALVLTVLAA